MQIIYASDINFIQGTMGDINLETESVDSAHDASFVTVDGDVIDSGTVQVFAESAPGEWTQSAEFSRNRY